MDESQLQQTQLSDQALDPEVQSKVEKLIEREMHVACKTFPDMMDDVSSCIVDNSSVTDKEAKQMAEDLLDHYWDAALAEERNWPEVTDGDKLTRAFKALEKRGIVARMHWECCQACGIAEIGFYRDEDTVGYVFFHEQDTDNLIEAGLIHLRYGSFTRSVKKNEAVGWKIIGSLRKAGLRPQWDGDPKTSIILEGLDWKKRLPGGEIEE